MSAFDPSAFDSAAFDAGAVPGGGETLIGTGPASFTGFVSVVNPLVFASSAGHVAWSASVIIDGVDVTGRLTGALQISAEEDSARLASFEVIPASAAQLATFDSAVVTIDVTLFRTGQQATCRRFTGRVESVEFLPGSRTARLTCRDGYQERPQACASAAEVEALFAGLAAPSPAVLAWNTAEPDPAGYFSRLLETLPGAVCLDSGGAWRVIPWTIGSAEATFLAGEILSDSVTLQRPARADVPSAIIATLTHRYPRLHAAEVSVSWAAVERARYVVDGLPTAPKSMIMQAVDSVPGWLVKGAVSITQPTPGVYPVIVGGQTVNYIVSHEAAAITAQAMSATLVKRWYQEVDATYSVTIDMGGRSERDTSIAVSISSSFTSSDWESAPSSATASSLYSANAPTVATPPTGYEGLLTPHPAPNAAVDHWADLSLADIEQAARHVVSRAVRKAAAGKRQQRIRFARPLDPRWEIGAVLAVEAYGVAGTGQVVGFEDSLDFDSGAAISSLTLACPDGSGNVTGATVGLTPPSESISHALPAPSLTNCIGAALETPAIPVEADLLGFLCNVLPTSANYDASKPVYAEQFRIVMPEVAATVRDPITRAGTLTASVQIAGSGVEVSI